MDVISLTIVHWCFGLHILKEKGLLMCHFLFYFKLCAMKCNRKYNSKIKGKILD